MEFGERGLDPRYVADAERDGAGIEAAVRERQAFGIARREYYVAVKSALRCTLAPDAEHFCIDIANRDPGAGASGPCDAERHVAGAAGNVQHRERPLVSGRVRGRCQDALPYPVEAP